MKLKSLLIVVIALAVVSIAAHFLTQPKSAPVADSRVGQPLIASSIIEQAHSFRLNENGKVVTLNKGSDQVWRIAEYHDFPADFAKLSRLVSDLTGAKLERLVTQNPERIQTLDFRDAGLAFLDASKKETWAVKLGRTAEGGGRFVRFGDENKAFLTRLNTYLDVEPKSWADATLLALKSDEIAQVEVSFPDGSTPLLASRAKKEDAFHTETAPAGKRLRNDRILSLIGSVGTLRFSESNDPTDANATAAKAAARSVKFTTFDGKAYTVAIGRKPEQKVIKAPEAKKDGSTGPAALGNLAALNPSKEKPDETKSGTEEKPADSTGPAQVAETTETIPAGPVFVFVTAPETATSLNLLMQKRAFQVYESTFTGLPAARSDLFEDVPIAPPAATPPPSAP